MGKRCDGTEDCLKGDDETDCPPTTCAPNNVMNLISVINFEIMHIFVDSFNAKVVNVYQKYGYAILIMIAMIIPMKPNNALIENVDVISSGII
jgi:hypothetical protein